MVRGGRGGGGRGRSGSIFFRELCRKIQSSGVDLSLDVGSIADELCNYYPPYRRHKKNFSSVLADAVSTLRVAAAGERQRRRRREDFSPETLSMSGSSGDSSSFSGDLETMQQEAPPYDQRKTSSVEGETPSFDYTKESLRRGYEELAKRRKISLEIEVANEKPKEVIAAVTNGGGSGSKPENSSEAIEAMDTKETTKAGEMKGPAKVRFKDLGGMRDVVEQLMNDVVVPLCQPHLLRRLGVRPLSGLLLYGPPGCGKTTLAHAIANETGVPFYKLSAPEVVSGVSGSSEENVRSLFKKAYRTAPSIVFIDEIDAIASKRENMQKEMERRIVTQLMTCMDEFHQNIDFEDSNFDSDENSQTKRGHVLVIGATNRPDALDPALRRPGRFDREITLGVPDENARFEILTKLIRNRIRGDFDLHALARSTPGFVGADLKQLVDQAGWLAMARIIKKMKAFFGSNNVDWWRVPWVNVEDESVTMIDFEEARELVQPSLRREGFSAIPNVMWEDVGGLDSLKEELVNYIVNPIKRPEIFKEYGVIMEAGFLLFGPPGCGKTLIAKAVANRAGASFIHIKGPELLTKYVGETESAIRKLFDRARTNAPCILFFDEVDALTTARGNEGGWVVERSLTQLLIEMNGADRRDGVYIIGATNRIEAMDPAILRSERLGKIFFVPLPSQHERASIMKAHARNKPIAADVNFDLLAQRPECNNLTGSDIAAIMNEAAVAAVYDQLNGTDPEALTSHCIKAGHFEHAIAKVRPSVSEEGIKHYESLRRAYCN